ncbi:MAG: YHYH protein [Reichenbachiella sp.]|uniref:YHYH protein n=1 Tax=Reichenbachiella sp. TaxID=2184521 RepID=UPI0032658EC2
MNISKFTELKSLILLTIFTLCANLSQGQAPSGISYQGIARDTNGNGLANQTIGIQFSILGGGVAGTGEYVETHAATTNDYGLFTAIIGEGAMVSGDFESLDWAASEKFIKVEIDPTGGSDYTLSSTTQLLSVPYALYAAEVANTDDEDADPLNEIQDLAIDNNQLSITGNESATTVDLSTYLDNTDAQELTLTGTELSISGGSTTVDLSTLAEASDDQTIDAFALSSNILSLSLENDNKEASTVDLSTYLDNTDVQTIDEFSLSSNTLSISIENDNDEPQRVDLSSYLDNTDNQELTLKNDVLSISGGTETVDLSIYRVSSGSSSEEVPVDPMLGQMFFNEVTEEMYVYTSEGWSAVTLGEATADISFTEDISPCSSQLTIDTNRGDCDKDSNAPELNLETHSFSIVEAMGTRTISTNSIPNHAFGLFGNFDGALNNNAISVLNETFNLVTDGVLASTTTPLLSLTTGPQYSFGILFSGIELDPEPAEPWPHSGSFTDPNLNWEWNMKATNLDLGFDCNNAHVQPQGKYHYHGFPTLFIESLGLVDPAMTLVGYAADGFPIYYKYGYVNPNDDQSGAVSLASSFQLKSGERPGDGITEPCGEYNGTYSNDYEYIAGLGDLDECNGRTGVTPEYPAGTYYYVLTETFPVIPRCFKGTPASEFMIN